MKPDLSKDFTEAGTKIEQKEATGVIFVGHFPPPVTGVSAINAYMAEVLLRHGQLGSRVNLTPSLQRGGVLYGAARALTTVGAMAGVCLARRRGSHKLYMALDGGAGILFNILIAVAARCCGLRIIVHHHSFAYVNKRSSLMAMLIDVLPRGTIHMVLCERMSASMSDLYQKEWHRSKARSLVLHNAFVSQPEAPEQIRISKHRAFTIGHLSNLCRAKGTHAFLDLYEALSTQDQSINAILAGPILEDDLRIRIESMQRTHGGRLSWLGKVAGESKTAFLGSIDVFVFPTQYEDEAQPLVLLEALCQGLPIVTIKRGCIGCDFDDSVGLIAADTADFCDRAANYILSLQANPMQQTTLRQAALRAYQEQRTRALNEFAEFLAQLLD